MGIMLDGDDDNDDDEWPHWTLITARLSDCA